MSRLNYSTELKPKTYQIAWRPQMEQYHLVLLGDVDSTSGAFIIVNGSLFRDTKCTFGIIGRSCVETKD